MKLTKRKAAELGFITASLLTVPGTQAQKKNSPTIEDRQREQHSLAINIVRAINAAEASYRKTQGTYVPWSTLFANGDFTDAGTKWSSESLPTVAHAMYGGGPEIVPGWKLRLNLSNDGSAYDLRLEDVSDPKCGYAVVSDERGMVRQAKSVDCTP